MTGLTRRSLLGGMTMAGAIGAVPRTALAADDRQASASMFEYAAPALEKVRCGIIGVGQRGTPMTKLLMNIDGAEINAICDIDDFVLDRAIASVVAAGRPAPARIGGDETAYRRLCERSDIDVVFVFTPWSWHAPMAMAAMHGGKHAFVEVPLATTIDDLWKLVETSEATRRHCMMMENCCYGREELMILNMVRQGLFGDLLHAEAAYLHDLRHQMKEPDRGEGVWRPHWQTRQRGNLYPTHGLGPVAQYMNINRGDRFDYLVSMDSPARGMADYAREHLPSDAPPRQWDFIAGDMNNSLIKTVAGRTILLQHNIDNPRPYDRLNAVQGTNGAFRGYPGRIALEKGGFSDNPHQWDRDLDRYYERYDHPLWSELAAEAVARGGHGGMDFVMLWRIVACLRNGLPVDQPVYDGAAWSAPFDLSDRSVRNRSAAQDFPDFTRGAWKSAASFEIVPA